MQIEVKGVENRKIKMSRHGRSWRGSGGGGGAGTEEAGAAS